MNSDSYRKTGKWILFGAGGLALLFLLGLVRPPQFIDQTPGEEIKNQEVNQESIQAEESSGEKYLVTRVIDGDTIEIEGGERIRYLGIDTPETVDPRKPVECFGREASQKNKELVLGKYVRLEKDITETDKYDRLLRYVFIEDKLVNLELVKEGFAHILTIPPDVKYTEEFLKAEREAREAKRGLWGACTTLDGNFNSSSCNIKGNISFTSGEKIYHLPSCDYYNQTFINEVKGERWFCSEAEAIAAGWRKAKNCP